MLPLPQPLLHRVNELLWIYLGNRCEKIPSISFWKYNCMRSSVYSLMLSIPIVFYRPQRSCEGYVFTPVCHSVHGGALSQCMLGYHPPQSRHPLGAGTLPGPGTPSGVSGRGGGGLVPGGWYPSMHCEQND